MKICASLWAVVSGCPLLCIDGFGGTEIERQLRDDLPTETEVETTTETVGGRDRIGVEHIVLVEVDTVGPFAGIEELSSEFQSYWTLDIGHWRLEIIRDILREGDAVRG